MLHLYVQSGCSYERRRHQEDNNVGWLGVPEEECCHAFLAAWRLHGSYGVCGELGNWFIVSNGAGGFAFGHWGWCCWTTGDEVGLTSYLM